MPSLLGTETTDIVLAHDGNPLVRSLTSLLIQAFSLKPVRLDEGPRAPVPAQAAVVCLGHLTIKDMTAIRRVIEGLSVPPIFVFPSFSSKNFEHAQAFENCEIFTAPLDAGAILAAVRRAVNRSVEASWSLLKPGEERALRASLRSFGHVFSATARGEPMPLDQVYAACEAIQDNIADSSIDRWLGALRQHHDSTYRHSMYVCGTLAYFGHEIGARGLDLKQLTVGGYLHDAGKARIPLDVLDKPGKLDDAEWLVMKRHPEYSREILLQENGLTEQIVEMAAHHHERIDGSGYPDGLKDGQITDIVRLTAIADVYSALTEPRAYKPAMSNEKAFEIMDSFNGHLDHDLLRRFREFILDIEGGANPA